MPEIREAPEEGLVTKAHEYPTLWSMKESDGTRQPIMGRVSIEYEATDIIVTETFIRRLVPHIFDTERDYAGPANASPEEVAAVIYTKIADTLASDNVLVAIEYTFGQLSVSEGMPDDLPNTVTVGSVL